MNIHTLNIISRHLHWISEGYSFHDIYSLRDKLRDENPFENAGTMEIQERIGGHFPLTDIITQADFDKLTFLIIDDKEFDADIKFIEYCRNIEQIYICGINGLDVIRNLDPLELLDKLRYLSLEYHDISDISALYGLINLEEVNLQENPVITIKPITHLKRLRSAKFSDVREVEVFELLKSSTECVFSYCSSKEEKCYTAYWLNGWAYNTRYYKDFTKITTYVRPLRESEFTAHYLLGEENDYNSFMQQLSDNIAFSLLSKGEVMSNKIDFKLDISDFLRGEYEYSTTI